MSDYYDCVSVWDYVPSEPEENDGDYVTDPSGYIPIDQQVEMLVSAGEQLNAYRKTYFGYDGDDDSVDPDYDPTTSLSFDEITAQQMAEKVQANMTATSSRVSSKKAVDASGGPATASAEASPTPANPTEVSNA